MFTIRPFRGLKVIAPKEEEMEPWRKTWREGIAPLLSREALSSLKRAMLRDDPALLQGATTTPPPLQCVQDWPVEAACALGFCGWKGEELDTVAEVEMYFANACYACDQRLGEPAAVRYFINWWDERPREEIFAAMLPEIDLALAGREPA